MIKTTLSRNEKIVEDRKEKARTISIWEAGTFSVSDGFGLRNMAPYALALNASNSMMGLLISIPSLFGNLSQLLTYRLLKKYDRKKVVIFAVFLQALFWLMLLIPGILFLYSMTSPNITMIVFLSLFTGLIVSGALAGPAWSSWMKDIVPTNELGKYFAKRNKVAGAIALVCTLLAGLILDYFKKIETAHVLYGFFILFFFSFLFRGIGGYLFIKKYEPRFKRNEKDHFGFFQFIRNMPFNNFGKFVLFVALVNFSVAIASPFFAVYLLKDKNFSYTFYTILITLAPIISIFTMSYFGRISDTLGNVKLIKLSGILIILVPFVYFLSSFFEQFWTVFLIVAIMEIGVGIGWSGFNLATSNFLFKNVSKNRMVICSSYMNVINGLGIFLGATLGGFLVTVPYWNPILLTFLASGIGRLIIYTLILPKIKEKADKKSVYNETDFISQILWTPKLLNQLEEITYFKRKVNKVKKSGLVGLV